MKVNETSIELEEQDVDRFFSGDTPRIPSDLPALIKHRLRNGSRFIMSWEAFQDLQSVLLAINHDRTGSIDVSELAEWKAADEYLSKMNYDEVRQRVEIETDFIPYEEW